MQRRVELHRALLVVLGLVFLLHGVAKAVDPTSYMLALSAFRVIAPVTLTPLSLAAVSLAWTALEIAAALAMLDGGLSRRAAPVVAPAGAFVGLGVIAAYLSLELGALARHLPIANCTCLGGVVALPLSLATIVFQACVALGLVEVLRRAPVTLRSSTAYA